MIYIKRFKFCFINVPKNASTSVRRFFIDNVVQPEDSFSNYYETEIETWSQNMSPMFADHSHMDVDYAVKNGLLRLGGRIVGVIRNPIERVLSLYLNRVRQGRVKNPGVADFRKAIIENGYYPDYPWQNQLQSSFLMYNGDEVGEWWLFDNIELHILTFAHQYGIEIKQPLKYQNRSLSNKLVKDYVSEFYDQETLSSVQKYYQQDIELYERIRNAGTNS